MPSNLAAAEEIRRYRPLICSRARRFWRGYLATRVTLEDLEEIAAIAVWDATRTYRDDHESGAKFGTYVTHLIDQAIKRERQYWRRTMRSGTTVSLSPSDDGEVAVTLVSNFVSASEQLEEAAWHKAVRDAVAALKPRQRAVIERRFWREESMDDAGTALGVSKQRVQQIEVEACERLRRRLKHVWDGGVSGG